ncbi:heat shock 70 kDa protein 12A-like [Mercenaria mercenaria]|uniref:heat shock 70 kDa protein 12A-like n=1 Tax=Mercenaria mercenaria TaxID=6596 RepID=UPI00234E4C0A|nr:heat shock 70 kDa protein 12A-like [Mercenaria mercenaria]XP_053399658.1 heat shock 70 kDa protein 12A-like [Mercenaria mercenaria]
MAGNSLLVAAIDFGTTYSGWAFSFKHEFERDATKVSAKNWSGGQLVSLKGPTCALIKSDKQTLDSFGYEAESKYADLATDGEHEPWYFFKRFKMKLFGQGFGRNLMLEDASGKKLLAKTVFSLCIKYLKDDLIKLSESRIAGGGLRDEDIHWVLTVPAIWNDAAKQFMREAAQEAGILEDKLTIALEPEAASLYCRHLPVEKCGSDKTSLSKFGPGKRYLVLDAGGGTVDITVHEVMSGGNLKELDKASGGAWGGVQVDDAFFQFLSEIAGSLVMTKFKDMHMEDYIDLFRDFEVKKREIGPKKDTKVTFRMPTALADLVKDMRNETLQETIKKTKYSNQVKLVGDKLRVDPAVVKGFFKPSVNSIVKHVKGLLRESTNSGVEAVLMVGGFSESPMLQETVRNHFPGLRIIIPDEAGLAVLKGAVIFGHSPATISQRVSKYTYGTDISQNFDQTKHAISRMSIASDGSQICTNIFSKLAEAGQTLVVGEPQDEQTYTTLLEDQTAMGMNIYASTYKNPGFIDDVGCQKIGTFSVPVSGRGKGRAVTVKMIFGGTEIDVECKEVATGNITHLKVDFLS